MVVVSGGVDQTISSSSSSGGGGGGGGGGSSGASPSYLDTTHSPVGLWTFNEVLTDSSGNGLTLSVATGTEKYSPVLPGIMGFYLDGSTYLNRAYAAALAITGDLTVEWVGRVEDGGRMVTHCGDILSATEANNQLYGVWIGNNLLKMYSENGGGTSSDYQLTASGNTWPAHHFAVTRTSNVIQFYVDGYAFGAASGTLTTPTGGTSGNITVGAPNNIGVSPTTGCISSLKIIASALSASQVAAEAELALGITIE